MESFDVTDIPLQRRTADTLVPLTAMQRRIWNTLLDGMSEMRMCESSARIFGPLNPALLRTSLETVMRRHESLRTRISVIDGVPRQQIDAACGCDLELVDLSGRSSTKIEGDVMHLAEEFVYEKTNLVVGPLFAAKLLRLSKHEHVLMLGIDHMFSDAASSGILTKEIWTAYNQSVQGLPHSLPNVSVQFGDYAVWQQLTYEPWRKKHEHYWRERLTGVPLMELPFDSGSSEVQDFTRTTVDVPLGAAVSARLRDIALRKRTLPALVALTIVAAVMSRWCGQRDFVVTFVSHGRHGRPELANTTGFLATVLYLRIEIAAGDSFVDLLDRVTHEFRLAQEHQDFDRVPDLVPGCTESINFNWLSTNWTRRSVLPSTETVGELDIRWFPIRKVRWTSRLPWRGLGFLMCQDNNTDAGVVMRLWYRTDLFASGTIERLSRNLLSLADELTGDPAISVASLRFAA